MAACCTQDTGKPVRAWRQPIGGTCSGRVTMDKAQAFCNAHGARLCELSEVALACGTGCNYDNKLTWTTTPSLGCTDHPASESSCELQLRDSDNCARRRSGILADGQCDRTCGLCTNKLDDWAVTQCLTDCDKASARGLALDAKNFKLDVLACKTGCSYFVRGPPSIYTGQGGDFFSSGGKRFYPPGPTDYWVGLEAAAVVDCKQACTNFVCRDETFLNQGGRFATECPFDGGNPVAWWVRGGCNLGCDLAAITRYNNKQRTVPACAQKDFDSVSQDCRCASGAPVFLDVKDKTGLIYSPLPILGLTPPVVDCEAGRYCYKAADEDRVRCHVHKKSLSPGILYKWVREFVPLENCPRDCGLPKSKLFGEVSGRLVVACDDM